MIVPEQIEARRRSIEQRLNRGIPDDTSQPVFSARNIHFELSERTHEITYGGIGLIHQLAFESGLVEAIDKNLLSAEESCSVSRIISRPEHRIQRNV